jgi:hypothetical protein
MLYYLYSPLAVVFNTLAFAANVLLFTLATVAELSYLVLFNFFHLALYLTSVVIPVLGKVLEGFFSVAIQVVVILNNVSNNDIAESDNDVVMCAAISKINRVPASDISSVVFISVVPSATCLSKATANLQELYSHVFLPELHAFCGYCPSPLTPPYAPCLVVV